MEERAIVRCLVELQEIGLAPRKIIKAPMEVLSYGLPTHRIKEATQMQWSVYKKPDTKGCRAIKIMMQMFDFAPMVFG